jgi:putative ABC transport system permease protein
MEVRPILSAMLRSKTAPLLVAIQVAISLAILANALYIVNLRYQTTERPSGIPNEQDVLYMQVRPVAPLDYNAAVAQQERDLKALAAIPGVMATAFTSQMPMSTSGSTSGYALDRTQVQPSMLLSTYFVTGDFIPALDLRLLEGRNFTASDVVEFDPNADDRTTKYARSIILTKAAADQLYPGTSAVGRILYLGTGDDANELRVVGVIERLQSTTAQASLAAENSALLPLRVWTSYSRYAVRTQPGQRDRVLHAAEDALRKATPAARLIRARTVSEDRLQRYRNERSLALTLVAVSVLLLLVTASGIVGMTMLRVAQRRKQIGVRRAIGARRADIVRWFVTENVLITTAGVAVGLLLAIALNQMLVSQLELPKLPLPYLLVGASTLWVLGIVSVAAPAWKAAGIPPAIATRSA